MRMKALMISIGLLLCATGCAAQGGGEEEDVVPDGIDEPSRGDDFDDFDGVDGVDGFDGFDGGGSSQEGIPSGNGFVSRGSFGGDLAYVQGFDVKNALVTDLSLPGHTSVMLEGTSDGRAVMVLVDMWNGSFADLTVGEPVPINELSQVYVQGCAGSAYETEVPGDEIELEEVEKDPEIGETLYSFRFAFHYDGDLQNVHAQISQPH